ncbi:MAG: glycosyltransferase, partial [Promethearchaeota archaeon]
LRTQLAEIFGKYLSKRHQIISIMKSNSKKKHFYWEGIEFYNLSIFNFIKKIFQLLKKEKFDLVFARDDLSLLLMGFFIKKVYRIPLIFQFTIPIKFITALEFKWYHPINIGGMIKHTLLLKFMKKADLILPISEWMGKYLASNGIDYKKIYNFPDGANPNLFRVYEYPLSVKNPLFIYIGALGKIRRLDVLIEAMNIVVKKFESAQLFLVGTGDNIIFLKSLTRKLELEKNISFTGLVPYYEVPRYIGKSHIALSPIAPYYHYKLSSPLKLFEYLSCSRPVIANKEIPAHLKIIKESQAGVLVDFNPESFAKAMINLFKNLKKAIEMGINGRKWVEKNRTYEKQAIQLEKKMFDFFLH